MPRIKLTKEEKKSIKGLVECEDIAGTAFVRASRMLYDANVDLWDRVKKMWPDALSLEKPKRGDWTVVTKEKD